VRRPVAAHLRQDVLHNHALAGHDLPRPRALSSFPSRPFFVISTRDADNPY
jgi:hypothetical protein